MSRPLFPHNSIWTVPIHELVRNERRRAHVVMGLSAKITEMSSKMEGLRGSIERNKRALSIMQREAPAILKGTFVAENLPEATIDFKPPQPRDYFNLALLGQMTTIGAGAGGLGVFTAHYLTQQHSSEVWLPIALGVPAFFGPLAYRSLSYASDASRARKELLKVEADRGRLLSLLSTSLKDIRAPAASQQQGRRVLKERMSFLETAIRGLTTDYSFLHAQRNDLFRLRNSLAILRTNPNKLAALIRLAELKPKYADYFEQRRREAEIREVELAKNRAEFRKVLERKELAAKLKKLAKRWGAKVTPLKDAKARRRAEDNRRMEID